MLKRLLTTVVLMLTPFTVAAESDIDCDVVAKVADAAMADRMDGWRIGDLLEKFESESPETFERNPYVREIIIQAYEAPAVDSARMMPGTEGEEMRDLLRQRFSDRWHVKCLRGNI